MKGREIFARAQRLSKTLVLAVTLYVGTSSLCASETDSEVFAQLDLLIEYARLDRKAPALVYGVVADGKLEHSGVLQLGGRSVSGRVQTT
jgi:hypothetical protein